MFQKFFQQAHLRHSKQSWAHVFALCFGHFNADFYANVLTVMLPVLALRFGFSYAESAALFMVFQIASNFMQPPIGLFADRKNLNALMPLSIVTTAIFTCLITSASSVFVLVVIVFLAGLCLSAFHPVAALIVAKTSPKKHIGFATSLFIAGGNIGCAISPVLVALFVEYFTEKYFLVLTIPAFICLFFILRQGLHFNFKKESKDLVLPSLKDFITNKSLVLLNIAVGLRSWVYCGFVVFIPLLLTDEGYTQLEMANALLVFLLGSVVGGLIVGGLSDKFKLKNIILCTFILTLIATLVFLFNVGLSFISLIALFVIGGAAYGSTPSSIVWAQRLFPQSAAFAASLMLGLTFGVGNLEAIITGYLGDFIGLRDALLWTFVPASLLSIVIMILLKEPEKNTQKKIDEFVKQHLENNNLEIKN